MHWIADLILWLMGLILILVSIYELERDIFEVKRKIDRIIDYQEKNPKVRTIYCRVPDKE